MLEEICSCYEGPLMASLGPTLKLEANLIMHLQKMFINFSTIIKGETKHNMTLMKLDSDH